MLQCRLYYHSDTHRNIKKRKTEEGLVIQMTEYLPEGRRILHKENIAVLRSLHTLEQAAVSGAILEAPCTVCDTEHNLSVALDKIKGIIPRHEGAIGISDGSTRDIALISRVGKPVCFKITKIDKTGSEPVAILSRLAAQSEAMENYISKLQNGEIIPARVTHLEQFGCFVDIGCGIPSMIPIDAISVSRINHPANRFSVGMDIFAAVKGRDNGRICLTHKELLGTWEQNANCFKVGETVSGIVRSIEEYGIFIELAPNLAGLAELKSGISVGDCACVYIKAIIPEKMKIKLIIVNTSHGEAPCDNMHYYLTEGKIGKWVYSTPSAPKYIATDFTEDNNCS